MELLNIKQIHQLDKNIINNYYKKLLLNLIGLVVYQVNIYMLMDFINLKNKEILEEQ